MYLLNFLKFFFSRFRIFLFHTFTGKMCEDQKVNFMKQIQYEPPNGNDVVNFLSTQHEDDCEAKKKKNLQNWDLY